MNLTEDWQEEQSLELYVALDLRLAWAALYFQDCRPGDGRSKKGWYDESPEEPVRPDSICVL